MTSVSVRLGRFILWIIVSVAVLLALSVTLLRIALPRLDYIQEDIESWVIQNSGFNFNIESMSGYWRNTRPSLSLKGLEAELPEGINQFSVKEIRAEFDLIESAKTFTPQVNELILDGLYIDITGINFTQKNDTVVTETTEDNRAIQQLERLLLRQLKDFSVTNSTIIYTSQMGEIRHLYIESLKWRNRGNSHQARGRINLDNAEVHSAELIANFETNGGFKDISGDFYLEVNDLQVNNWLQPLVAENAQINDAIVSGNVWLNLKNNKPVDAFLEVRPSEVTWSINEQPKSILLDGGVIVLDPEAEGWQLSAHALQLSTNNQIWPEMDLALRWQPDNWQANLSEIDISCLTPILELVPDSKAVNDWISTVNLDGTVQDIRVSMRDSNLDSLRYSATLVDGSMRQWQLLPGINQVGAQIAGKVDKARAKVTLIDDVLPYGDVFQAALNMKQTEMDIIWESNDDGWRLWSEKVTAATPDLQVLGAFRLDFPKDKPSFLSFYAEADLHNAGETWRYLPTLALGQGLTDYLSSAIQGGNVKTAKLLWYGELGNFPYRENNGMFQAWVPLQNTKFSFSTDWPPLEDTQLDLLFQNETMFLESNSSKLMDVDATYIVGQIPQMNSDGHIEIKAQAKAEGSKVRDYMMATPLVDSVGAALTAVDISQEVEASFELFIPFDLEKESRAWGHADLLGNTIQITAPPMLLKDAVGRVEFDNDIVKATGLTANLLDQPIYLDFSGENHDIGYATKIDVVGDWDAAPLLPYLGEQIMGPLSGHAPWEMAIDLQLNDIGFTYQLDTKANLQFLASEYPAPLNKEVGDSGSARLQASGNQESISARLQLPTAKFQTEINILPDTPVLEATNLVIGSGSFKVSPIVGHHAAVRTPEFDLDHWYDIVSSEKKGPQPLVTDLQLPEIPMPTRISIETDSLTLAGLNWSEVDFLGRKKGNDWQFDLTSSQGTGEAYLTAMTDLAVTLDRLQIYVPGLEEQEIAEVADLAIEEDQPLISDFDRQFHQLMPNLELSIDDLWLQGYKVGQLNMSIQREQDTLKWKRIAVSSGDNAINSTGGWTLDGDASHSELTFDVKGKDNSDIMARFGISSGIQKAPFEMEGALKWDGAPWSMKVDTLNGDVSTEFGRGVISDIGGAAKLLGMFSLDSIVKRLQLDFTDIFDDGLAFDSITGTGSVENGVFLTNNIELDSFSGDLSIKGIANLNTQMVDASVSFRPDLTSGIPALTAFAVAPQAALYVLAVTTVIAPVVEVITQVTYEVKGPINSPTVKESSRRKDDYQIPDEYRKEAQKK